jgi:hypothetical protein
MTFRDGRPAGAAETLRKMPGVVAGVGEEPATFIT